MSGPYSRGNDQEKDCLLGMVEGMRARGRQRTKYMDGIKEIVGGGTIDGVLRIAEDRSAWRSIVANINVDTAYR